MRANELRMEELLKFLPEEGKIVFNGSRAVIFDAYAMGMLRKDLIETLGMDRAKGFLIRYGWSLGFRAAITIKEQFKWDNQMEWTYAGPILHTLTGFVLAQPNVDDFDPQTGIWFKNAIWKNSVEAEQHIQHLGYHHEPVCWMLTGFASGYNSAYLGEKVIFKEIKCAGKGDEYCTNIGKTIGDWGEEILPELAYYEINKISEELQAAHRRIVIQNRILERTLTIHERLTQCILTGKGVEDIAASLSTLMKCTVILEDRHLVLQSTCFPDQDVPKDLLTPYLSIRTSPSFNKNPKFYIEQKRPFRFADQYSDILIYRLVSPILVGSELLGFVSLLRAGQPFSELENVALEHGASVFALEILKKNEIAEVENRLKGDFVDDLLSANFSDPNSIINRARGLKYDITLPHRVLVLEISNFTQMVELFKQNGRRVLQFKTELANTVTTCLDGLAKGIIVNKNDHFIILVQLNNLDNPEKDTRQLAELMIKKVSGLFPKATITIGIGSISTDLSGFHQSFLSAKKAIEIGIALNKQGQAVSLEQFGAHSLLFSALNPTDLYRFATSQIGSLLAHDETYQSQLISTLQELLNQGNNVLATARALNLSISGLKYRLSRIEEIAGQNLKDPQVCFNFQLALNILHLAGGDKLKA